MMKIRCNLKINILKYSRFFLPSGSKLTIVFHVIDV